MHGEYYTTLDIVAICVCRFDDDLLQILQMIYSRSYSRKSPLRLRPNKTAPNPWYSCRVTDCGVRGLGFIPETAGSILTSTVEQKSVLYHEQFGIEYRPMPCTVKWVKKVSYGGAFDLTVEQLQLFRKLH